MGNGNVQNVAILFIISWIRSLIEEIGEIDNEAARKLLNLPDSSSSQVSRLFSELIQRGMIEIGQEIKHNQRIYILKKE